MCRCAQFWAVNGQLEAYKRDGQPVQSFFFPITKSWLQLHGSLTAKLPNYGNASVASVEMTPVTIWRQERLMARWSIIPLEG